MKSLFFKAISLFTVFLLVVSSFALSENKVEASSDISVEDENSPILVNEEGSPIINVIDEENFSLVDVNYAESPSFVDADGNIQPLSLKATVSFLGGVICTIFLGGTIIYATGRSAEEWVANGLRNMEEKIRDFWTTPHPRFQQIHVDRKGNLSGTGRKW